MQTVDELLQQATKKLREFGFADEHLNAIRFNPKDRFRPVQDRSFTWHPSIPVETYPAMISIMREFLTLRFAVFDSLDEGGWSTSDAFMNASLTLAAPLVEARLKYLVVQKNNAQRQRGLIPEIEMTMGEFAKQFARKPDNLFLKPREMWPSFFGEMGFARLDPVRKGESYLYLGRSISFRTFSNNVREARKEDEVR